MNTLRSNESPTDSSLGSAAQRSPEDIETEIEETRGRLDRTLDALQSRLSPSERLRSMSTAARDMGQRAAGAARTRLAPYITTMIQIDHTHVLAVFRRIRPWTSRARKQALVANACLALEVHAQLEEEVFYPAMRRVLTDSDTLDASVPEHDRMRDLIRQLRAMEVADPGYDEKVRQLMQTVLHHVADEESVLLPRAEALLGEELATLGMAMTRRRLQLLRPHLKEVAVTTAQSFPLLSAGVAVGVLGLIWLALRPGTASEPREQ